MDTYQYGKGITVYNGDCLDALPLLENSSIDSIVTDPPYEISLTKWDSTGIAFNTNLWEQCLRVAKPGAYALVFGSPRTYHRLTAAIEDAGWEIRDSIFWLHNQGMPKGIDVSKAIDKLLGAKREPTGTYNTPSLTYSWKIHRNSNSPPPSNLRYDKPATGEARQWHGWNTALKPSYEPIVVARKPLQGTAARNVLQHGTGALNVKERVTTKWPTNIVATHLYDCTEDVCVAGCAVVMLQNAGTCQPSFYFAAKPNKTERPKHPITGIEHPTVKPLKLLEYLVSLVTRPDGLVLEPFAGSGTTIEACRNVGRNVTAIEKQADYLPLIEVRATRNLNR